MSKNEDEIDKWVEGLPAWQGPAVTKDDQVDVIKNMGLLLDQLRPAINNGQVAAISVVIVGPGMTPQHVFVNGPYTSAIMVAAMEQAKIDLLRMAQEALHAKRPPATSSRPPEAPKSDAPEGGASG